VIALSLKPRAAAVLLTLTCAGFGLWGLRWGLPSPQRTDLFLPAQQQTPEFFKQVDSFRTQWYQKLGESPIAYLGRSVSEKPAERYTHNILSSYSSFLVRTHDGDEQQTLVMLSRLNPLKGKWYPHSFQYGGAYIYPLAVFVGLCHSLHLIRLVPEATFYYAHPEKIAAVYTAVRVWSLLGLTLSVLALFMLCRRYWGTSTAFWAALFYALSPAAIAFAKIAKPHLWSPLWVLLAIYACLAHRADRQLRAFMLAALMFGIALATTMSQWIYVPLLFWSAWDGTWKNFFFKSAVGGAIVGIVFLACNPTLPFHITDFRYEISYLSSYYRWTTTWKALGDYFFKIIPTSVGIGTCLLAYAGVFTKSLRRKDPNISGLAIFWLLTSFYIAFQVQSTHGAAVSSRLYMTHVALCGLFCSAITSNIKGGGLLRSMCAVLLLAQAALMCRHCSSDVVPNDNATQAGLWIRDNIPLGSSIGMDSPIPNADTFPPIYFQNYTLVGSEPGGQQEKSDYYVLHGKDDGGRASLLKNGYVLIQRFAASPLQRWGFQDQFTNANFVVEIYRKDESNRLAGAP
jgi:hypothetical protein